jgi:hypothetical protein
MPLARAVFLFSKTAIITRSTPEYPEDRDNGFAGKRHRARSRGCDGGAAAGSEEVDGRHSLRRLTPE